VTVADGRSVVVEVVHDARIREVVQLSFGRVLHPEEVAADKTLALFGRAAARDLVDVAALSERYTLEQLCELAPEKDAGFDRRVLATRWPLLRLAPTPPVVRDQPNVIGNHPPRGVEPARRRPSERPAAASSRAAIGHCFRCHISAGLGGGIKHRTMATRYEACPVTGRSLEICEWPLGF